MGLNFLFLILYVGLSTASSSDGISMYMLLMFHCSLKLLLAVSKRGKGISLIHTYYLGVLLISFANIVFLNKIYENGLKEYYIYAYISMEYISDAALLWAVGSTFIMIGYELFERRSLPSLRVDLNSKASLSTLYRVILFFIFLRFSGNAINLGFISGGLQQLISLMSLMGILFFARLWVVKENNTYRNYAIVICVLQTLMALYSSYLRIDLMTPIVSFYGGYFIGTGKVKSVFSIWVLPLFAAMIIFSMFFNSLGGNRAGFINAFETSGQSNDEYSYEILNDEVKDRGGVVERNSNVAQLSNVIDLVESNGLYKGSASYPLLTALIPRALWPEKPNIQLGAWFALEIGAASITSTGRINNSVNMTVPGELYLDFGWIGVIIGCTLFGGFQAVFWNAAEFNASPYNLTGALWGGYLLLLSLFGMGSDLQIVISLLSSYFVFILVKQIAKAYENSNSRTALARK